jgi:putative tryptophan/tyrosine transport system substrate-binding protein
LSTQLSLKLKTLCLLALLQLLCVPFRSYGQEVTVVQSLRVRPYNEALAGFRSICSAEGRRFVLTETPPSEVERKIRDKKPKIILAIGGGALNAVRGITDVPIIYVMVPAQQAPAAGEARNISGVSLTIAPEKQLSLLQQALPSVKRIGVIYDPAKSSLFLKKARVSVRDSGMELIAREVHNPKEVPARLQSLKGSIDLFWMLPDTTVVTPETVEYFLLFSLESRIPILSFSEKYVEQGALLSFDIDPVDLGRQAGEMARLVLAGNPLAGISPTDPRSVLLTVNSKVAKNLGRAVSRDMIDKAKIY